MIEQNLPATALPLLSAFNTVRVVVLGDAILDHYVEGEVHRISPESPVPILMWQRQRYVAGGSANVAANIVALGGTAVLLAVVGEDQAAGELVNGLPMGAREHVRLIVDQDRPTTVKTRYVCGNHQLLRVDREQVQSISASVAADLCAIFDEECRQASVVVLSDYNKGALNDAVLAYVINRAHELGVPVLVDPKRKDFNAYRGATLIAPNRRELTEGTGLPCMADDDAATAAAAAIALTGAAILLTRSEDGMSLFRDGEVALHLPTEAIQVADVTGAGDTVMAAMALGIGCNAPISQVMHIANTAAGIVVTKPGTAVVTQAELQQVLHVKQSNLPDRGARVTLDEARLIREHWAASGLSVGFTNGCFDILHPGHLSLLRQAAAACDRLIVAVNSDLSVKRLKGPSRPVQTEAARAEMLGGIECVSLVLIFEEDTPLEVIEALRPDVLVKGADYQEDQVVGADIVKAHGGRIVLAGLVDGQSTTRILRDAAERTVKICA